MNTTTETKKQIISKAAKKTIALLL